MTGNYSPNGEIQELVQQYKEDHDLESVLSTAKQTSKVVRLLTETLVQEQKINTDSVTVLQRLCKTDNRYPVDSKIDDVYELRIPESIQKRLESLITESVGSVGGPLFEFQIPEEYEQEALEFLRTLVTATKRETLDAAIEEFASHDISGLQSGRISPIIHYLHPTKYPIVNRRSREGIETYFDRDIPSRFKNYLTAVDEFRAVRDEYRFNDHFRHLDRFFIWADRPSETGYFILRTGSDEYSDAPEEEYHFREGIPGSNQIREYDKVRAIYLENEKFYATATIDHIVSEERDDETHYFAQATDYDEIEPISVSDVRSDIDQSLSLPYGIIKISEEDFQAILDMSPSNGPNGSDIALLQEWLTPPQISISLPERLYFDSEGELKRQIEATLNSGKHIIFTGPPGTGKTKLAKEIANQCAVQYPEHVDGYRFTTATSAWTTFDTIGGYVPRQQADGDELVFQPRIFLNCFREDEIRNDWLVIDEINRSDIDKAFGQLFSVLSGDTVELPYERDEPVEIVSLDADATDRQLKQIIESDDLFPVTPSWRLLATMNTYDKASLYELSYAFMRRFNFIHVGVPDLQNEDGEIRTSLLDINSDSDNYATKWAAESEDIESVLQDTYEELAVVWERINEARSIGPSIVRDILAYIGANDTDDKADTLLTDAIIALVYPQLEGMRPQDQKQLVESLSADDAETETGGVSAELERERLRRKAEDFFNIEFTDDE